jgi:hypothetical protein
MDRAPKRPAGKTAAPTTGLMAITVAIYRRKVQEGRKKLRKLLLLDGCYVLFLSSGVADVFATSEWAQFIGRAPGW